MCVRVANAYVCIYVCMYVCMYLYIYVCIYVHMYERTPSSVTYRSVSVVLPADTARAAGEEDSKNCERRGFISKLIAVAVVVVYGGLEHVLPAIQ